MTSHCCVWLCDRQLKNSRHRTAGMKVVYFGAFATISARRFVRSLGWESGHVGVGYFAFNRYLCDRFLLAAFFNRRGDHGVHSVGS